MSQRINTQCVGAQSIRSQQQNKVAAKQAGMTFIEVLIALVIMVTGILGAVAMQATAKKGSFDAMQRSLASSLAQDIVERMRASDANPANGILALYAAGSPYGAGVVGAPAACNSVPNICNPTQMVTHDLYGWEQALMGADVKNGVNNFGGLVGGIGCVTVNGNTVTVAVTWQGKAEYSDAKKANCGTESTTRRQVVINAFII